MRRNATVTRSLASKRQPYFFSELAVAGAAAAGGGAAVAVGAAAEDGSLADEFDASFTGPVELPESPLLSLASLLAAEGFALP